MAQIIKSSDSVEQTKQIKYSNLVANSIMLQNVVDLTDVLAQMASEGYAINKELVACLSPYIRDKICRLGKYDLDMEQQPPH